MTKISKFLNFFLALKKEECILLILSTLFVFFIFMSYAILRPIRDGLGLTNSHKELRWLFLASFIAMLLCSTLAMYISSKIKRKNYISCVFFFFIANLICFYIATLFIHHDSEEFKWFARIFYVWVSVFNLFIISSAWSLLVDIFNEDSSKRLFGIISAGASLGSIAGAGSATFLVRIIGDENLILLSIILLCVATMIKSLLISESYKLLDSHQKDEFMRRFLEPIGAKNPFAGFTLIVKSPYLLALVAFILLLTSVSTFLYMEQGRIIEHLFPTKEAKIAAFASIDLAVQLISFIIQIFFTSKIAVFWGTRFLLSILGFIVGIGFIVLSFTHPAFLPLAIIMGIRRIGEYALVKPGREMLFVRLNSDVKYKVKNFLDTALYRAGDAISSQIEGAIANISISGVLLTGAILSFIWGFLGFYLGNTNIKNE